MDIEFHYYMTCLIALRAGFRKDDAYTIAYSSQYTDDNDYPYTIQGGDGSYENLISQTTDITKPQEERLSIYPVFHFCPGTPKETHRQSSSRTDGRYHPLNTIQNNDNARRMLSEAVRSGNLYRIGIAAHTYADTFCHRDFVGCKDNFNWIRIEGLIKGLLDDILPCIGHALALLQPDIPALVWEDTRLASQNAERRNKVQVLSAAGELFDCFCTMTKPNNTKSIKRRLLGDLGEAIGEDTERDSGDLAYARIKNYKTLLGVGYVKYNETNWFDEAVRHETDPRTIGTSDIKYNYYWKGDYRNSNWYMFQEAVKEHKAKALTLLNGNFEAAGMNISGDW